MTTYYLDYVNGNDASDGSSWANAWKTFTNGATAARITAGDTIRVAKSGDPTSIGSATWTVRPNTNASAVSITSSTNASPIQITKTSHGFVTGDIVNITGHNTNTSANGVWKVTRVDDNNYTLDGSVGVGTGGASGTATKCNWQVVELPSALTYNINRCGHEGNWTSAQGSNVVCSADTVISKDGRYSMKLACASGATTGLAAYYATGDLDLSSYQQISFWFYTSTALSADDWKLVLCSDVAGATPVYTASIPAQPQVNRWASITVNIGSSMSTTIKSVALYQNVDKGAHNVYVNNILACKAASSDDAITLNSLISKNSAATGGSEEWQTIQAINQNLIVIGEYSTSGLGRNGYFGASGGSATTYKREYIPLTAVTYNAIHHSTTEAGSAGNLITYSGGWNTSTTEQDGETWFGTYNECGYGIVLGHNYTKVDKVSVCKCYVGIRCTGSYIQVDNAHAPTNSSIGVQLSNADYSTVGTISANGCAAQGVYLNTDYSTISTISAADGNASDGILITGTGTVVTTITRVYGNGSSGIEITGTAIYLGTISSSRWNTAENIYLVTLYGCTINAIGDLSYSASYGLYCNVANDIKINSITTITANSDDGIFIADTSNLIIRSGGTVSNNTGYALTLTTASLPSIYVANMTTSGNTVGGIFVTKISGIFLQNCTIGEATEVAFHSAYLNSGSGVYSSNQDGSEDNHWQFFDYGTISSDATTRHTASGISWKVSPTSQLKTSYFPMTISLAKIACSADSEVTVTAYCKKSHATDIGARLRVYAGQLAGITTQTDTKADDTDWEQLSISFTPTDKGVVEILGEVWWAANTADESVYWDDITVVQA